MELSEGSPVTLRDCDFVVTQKNEIELLCKYVRNTEVRDAAQKLIEAVAERYQKSFFSDICGLCGACCRERTVRLNAHDIQSLAFYLGYTSEQQFREEYVEPSTTWNIHDGVLKKNGTACIFLKEGSTSAHLCSVYPARPALCASLPASQDFCRKNTGRIICQVFSLLLDRNSIIITMKGDSTFTISPFDEELTTLAEGVWNAVDQIPEEPDETSKLILADALDTLNDLMRHYFTQGATPGFAEGLTALLLLVNNIGMEQENCEELFLEITGKAEFLQSLMTETSHASETSTAGEASIPPAAMSNLHLDGIRLYPEWACITGKKGGEDFACNLLYHSYPDLMARVRELVDVAASSPLLQDFLWHQDPRCFLCGECCRRFKVEITYPEIVRLAEHMKLSEEETIERYFHPPIFSWNAKNGIIAKLDGARLDTEESSADCIFLQEKSKGVYHCKVYEGRPEVCSTFSPNNRPCRDLSRAAEQRPLAASLHHIDLIGERAYVAAHATAQGDDPPMEIFTRQYPQVHSICTAIKKAIMESIESAPHR